MGDVPITVEKMKKEIRGGPGEEMTFREFLEVSTHTRTHTRTHTHTHTHTHTTHTLNLEPESLHCERVMVSWGIM